MKSKFLLSIRFPYVHCIVAELPTVHWSPYHKDRKEQEKAQRTTKRDARRRRSKCGRGTPPTNEMSPWQRRLSIGRTGPELTPSSGGGGGDSGELAAEDGGCRAEGADGPQAQCCILHREYPKIRSGGPSCSCGGSRSCARGEEGGGGVGAGAVPGGLGG